jgi:hypothetical protein
VLSPSFGFKLTTDEAGNETVGTGSTSDGCVTLADDLLPGTYYLWETSCPDGWVSTMTEPVPVELTLPAEPEPGYEKAADYGNVPLGQIQVCKFYDYNENGVKDAGESALSNPPFEFKFTLKDENGIEVGTLSTEAAGCVTFPQLRPGIYYLWETSLPKGGWVSTMGEPLVIELKPDATSIPGYEEAVDYGNVLWQDETAWATGDRYVEKGDWATYVKYEGEAKAVTLYAGQWMNAGTVTFSGPVDGWVTITISLDGWSFADDRENIKVQDYAEAPSGKPSPGRFEYKTTAPPATISVPENDFYGVHVDLERKVPYDELGEEEDG